MDRALSKAAAAAMRRTIVDSLNFRMKSLGLTRKQLAQRLGFQQSFVNEFLDGKNTFYSITTIAEFAAAVGLTPAITFEHLKL